jgi:gamma-glutamyltranspeptidase/glutathione hydrolase
LEGLLKGYPAMLAITRYLVYSLLLIAGFSIGQPQHWDDLRQQRFYPVLADQGMVVSSDTLASRIGRDILRQGGNAVDAAVAVGFALAVSQPHVGNLGGGGFMLIHLAKSQQNVAINYRETAPLKAKPALFLNNQGQVDKAKLTRSTLSPGVPGTVAGLTLALARYGTLPLAKVLEPAIKLAESGIKVTPQLAGIIASKQDLLGRYTSSRKIFFNSAGKPLQAGDLLLQKDLAQSLKLIARQGPKAFYQGPIAKKIVNAMKQHGGLISKQDLTHYQAQVLDPIAGTYRGYNILSMPPPSSGGITLIETLNILEGYPIGELGLNSAQTIHLMTEALNLAFKDRNAYLGDPDFVTMPVKQLTDKAYAKRLRQRINSQRHTPAKQVDKQPLIITEGHDTTHFSIADKEGNLVANTYTLNFYFGNGQVVPGTGILLNNELDDFTIKPGVANSFGLIQSKANLLAPGKRPLSSMAPTIVLTADHKPLLATGSPGGSRIISTILQVISNFIDHGLNPAEAVSMARIHSQLWPDRLELEPGISPDTIKLLQRMGHKTLTIGAMGAAHTVGVTKQFKLGAADPRRPQALAAGY